MEKFVTKDNDYFFEPSVAIMYMVFIVIVFAVHMIKSVWTFTKKEYLINALRGIEEVVLHDLDDYEKRRALMFLAKSNHEYPLTTAVRELIINTAPIPSLSPGIYIRLKRRFVKFYERVVGSRYFKAGIVIFSSSSY